jgi:DNA-binding HxlR family transcriptional regulator
LALTGDTPAHNAVGLARKDQGLRDFFLHGPRRFQQFHDSLKGIAPTTLSERLRTLEENGVVERRFYSMSPPRAEYVLTAKGRDLGPIVRAMRDWGASTRVDHTQRQMGPPRSVAICL